jgi:hypothetical protein
MTASAMYVRGSEFRLHVLAPNLPETIQFAGGWIFDMVRMGWSVSVAVPQHSDDRAIRILGATAVECDSMLQTVDGCGPTALAVATALYDQEERVGQVARALLARGNPRLMMWGDEPLPKALRHLLGPAEHRLSTAARCFKAHALPAAEAAPVLGDTEVFHCTKELIVTRSAPFVSTTT